MTNTGCVKTIGRRLLKQAVAPTVLTVLAMFGSTSRAFGQNPFQISEACQGPDGLGFNGCQVMEGSWLYTVSLPIPGSAPFVFLGTETYAAGGGYSEADQLSFTPGYLATAGHGAWKATGGGNFLLTYVNLTYDASGSPTGSSKVRQTMRLDRSGMTYSGSGDYAYYDLNGGVVAQGIFTITAKRILVQQPQ